MIFACHSDQALACLSNPSGVQKEVLGAIPYSHNEVVLHTDESVLPKRKRAWASWNYELRPNLSSGLADKSPASVTYNMNICLLYTSPSPRDLSTSRMPSSA